MLEVAEAVLDEREEGRRIALHDEGEVGVVLAELANADVCLEPVVGHEARVRAALVKMPVQLARDAVPRRLRVLRVPVQGHDEEQARVVVPDPAAGVILVRDRVDAEARDEGVDGYGASSGRHISQRLGQDVGAAPEGYPEWTLSAALIGLLDELLGSSAEAVLVEGSQSVHRPSGHEAVEQVVSCGVSDSIVQKVGVQVVDDASVCTQHGLDGLLVDGVVLPHRGDSGNGGDVDLVGVCQQSNERHLIVGLIRHVSADEGPRLGLVA